MRLCRIKISRFFQGWLTQDSCDVQEGKKTLSSSMLKMSQRVFGTPSEQTERLDACEI